jgi:S-adenosylmethionine synthetase
MFYNKNYYTVESVTPGHPDKICDQISDAFLDGYLAGDPHSRVAVECFGCHGLLVVGGEVTSTAKISAENIARDVYHAIGYDDELEIISRIVQQSPDIACGVDSGGAGDQGIMYGYATDETEDYLPRGVVMAHALARELECLRTSGVVSWLQPDGKTQVTMHNGVVTDVLVSTQHACDISHDEIVATLVKQLIMPIIGDLHDVHVLINPTGIFTIGGFAADTGLTGRKIMVDTYGGLISHGGGCFSGKDASKVDRSGAYMARCIAKNLVVHGHAKECLVSIAYAIGKKEPVMVTAINERGEDLAHIVTKNFDLTPQGIATFLDLTRPIFRQTATYGHFGAKDRPWEQIIDLQ